MRINKKRLIIVTPEYSGNKLFDGGLSSFLDKFINLIHPMYELHIITPSNRNKTTKKEKIVLHEIKLNVLLKSIKYLNIKLFIYIFYYPLQSLILNNFIKKISTKKDLFFYTNFEYLSLFQPKNINAIVRISSFDHIWFKRDFLSTYISKLYDHIVLNKSKQIWSTSKFISRFINKKFKKKIIQIPPFMNNNERFRFQNSLKKFKKLNFILYIGTISRRKGIHLLPKLFSEIYKKNNFFKFIVIGRDIKEAGESNLNKYFKNKNFSKNLVYLGVRKKNFFLPLIKYARVVVIPSLIETSPQILQETLAYDGIPMCSKNTSMEEMLKNDKNFLFKKNNDENLVRQTFKLMSKNEKNIRLKVNFFKNLLFDKSRKNTILLNLKKLNG